MKIDIFDVNEFVELNHLQEVTSPVLYQRGDVPDPNGLISDNIFGVTVKDRKETFAYISLNGHFFHPHIYKVIKRIFRNVERIVNGSEYYIIDKNGLLQKDDNGETGIEFLYNNWDKIDWEKSDTAGMRNERVDLITHSKKDEIFWSKLIVIPAFYRDMKSSSKGGGDTSPLNTFYCNIIRYAALLKDRNMFDFSFHNVNYNVQNTLVEIYDYFKVKLEKKSGLFRKYLMGKNVDFCTRTVISGPTFHANSPEDLVIKFDYCGVPISQVCSLCYPFVIQWVKQFFENNVINQKELYLMNADGTVSNDIAELKDPSTVFTEKYFQKKIDQYVKGPETRFDPIEIPLTNGSKKYMYFTGRRFTNSESGSSERASISHRRMTWTDILYMASVDVTRDKHLICTRYPVSDVYGIFIAKVHIISTQDTEVMQVGETVYKHYPCVIQGLPHDKVTSCFVESCQFPNSYLPGLNGDYDGDQTTMKIVWSLEANKECEEVINRKSNLLGANGGLIRHVGNEADQTIYTMTKDPTEHSRTLSEEERTEIVHITRKELTFDKWTEWFAVKYDEESGKTELPKYHCQDVFVLKKGEYAGIKEDTKTTVGKYLFNRFLFGDTPFESMIPYANNVLYSKDFGNIESTVAKLLLFDRVTTEDVKNYIDRRDWMGFQIHSLITTSFTMETIKTSPEVRKLRDELYKKYKKELEAGDTIVMAQIEKALIDKTMEVLKDNPGMDLYVSGARGSVGNNMKNMMMVRGSVKNSNTGKYDLVLSSLNDGLRKEDIPAASNVIVGGAYPKAVGTQVSGYISKQLSSSCQTEILDVEGSDCGTKRGIPTIIRKKHIYRYIIDGGKLVLLDDNNINKYLGKKMMMRSPLSCVLTKNHKLCNKCCGNFYYMLDNMNIGLSASKVGTSLTNLGMKKFHNNVLKFHTLDPDDMLI